MGSVYRRRADRLLGPAAAEEARQLYQFGEKLQALAARYGVSISTMLRAVAAARPQKRRRAA